MLAVVGRRVGPVERVAVRQRHVAGAELVEPPQVLERVLDRVAAFDADQRGDLARFADPLDVGGRAGQLERVGVASIIAWTSSICSSVCWRAVPFLAVSAGT